MIIYCAFNIISNKAYVGYTRELLFVRRNAHLKSANDESQYHFHKAIRKYGAHTFIWITLQCCSSIEQLKHYEQEWIRELGSFANGYNMTKGGDGTNGYWEGKTLTQEHKKNIGNGNKGKIVSVETRKKLSEAAKNRKYSEKTKQKMSESHKGEKNSMYGTCGGFKNKTHTVETKKKISDSNKRWHFNNRKHQTRSSP
jgi:group I intron endonuclease